MSKVNIGPISSVALVITDQETNAQIKNLGVGLLELRVDLFKKLDPSYVIGQIQLRKRLKTPLLLTLRNDKKEGAVKTYSDRLKWQIISAALPMVDMVDIELGSPLLKPVIALARRFKKKVIVSSHHLQGMPRDLGDIFKMSLTAGADIVKIACKAKKFDDVMTMLVFTRRHHKKGLITMCLGSWGALSRLVFPAAGSRYTYTFLNKPTASGQVDIRTLKSHMKIYYS